MQITQGELVDTCKNNYTLLVHGTCVLTMSATYIYTNERAPSAAATTAATSSRGTWTPACGLGAGWKRRNLDSSTR